MSESTTPLNEDAVKDKGTREYLSLIGRKGGMSRSPAKIEAARRNAVLGGKAKGKRYSPEQLAAKRELLAKARAKRERDRLAENKVQREQDAKTDKRERTLQERRNAWIDGEGNVRYD